MESLDRDILNSLNEPQEKVKNKENLDNLGGIGTFCEKYFADDVKNVNYFENGLSDNQVEKLRSLFGDNEFPESPLESFLSILLGVLSDPILIVLLIAAAVSLAVGIYEDPGHGWTEGVAIFAAVILVSLIGAGNDYSKQLQFRDLEKITAKDEVSSVLRNGKVEIINPKNIVIGDILVLQAGDMIPADCVMLDLGVTIKANESSLTGEPEDIKKERQDDCFLLSSCLVTTMDGASNCKCVAIGIGAFSQWGKIKANLVSESVNTPLQDKLEEMTKFIGYIGLTVAIATFIALIISIWARHGGENVADGVIEAFIIGVTIIVVAIPEGLPLAVTISLSYSSKKMYEDKCLIRYLAACETMGNATNICTDKTGTLTENQMTVVEGWFGNKIITSSTDLVNAISPAVKTIITEQVAINRTAYLVQKDNVEKPVIVGSKTEGALLLLAKDWGTVLDAPVAVTATSRNFPFDSMKKRSTAINTLPDGLVRLYCKGASETILKDCTMFLEADGLTKSPLTDNERIKIEDNIKNMNNRALRTLCLAHKDYKSWNDLPADWENNPPDNSELILDCIIGIEDPIRKDVKEAVATAIRAGIKVRMVTGDNIDTACAIARQCGILTEDGIAMSGTDFRKMKPADLDAILPSLQVLARSSPNDKFLLVTRLNGHSIPKNKEEWEERVKQDGNADRYNWDEHRDLLLPGYREEWEATRGGLGEVVAVTGDGTNDAPALKAADVGMAMGITGTKVAQGAADIVILDDQFSSIITAISWGRCVFDNIRRFLQFQLTVNLVALSAVFLCAVLDLGTPLNAVQLLWTNLVMDTLGALALATEPPTPELLQRRPYKRSASLVSRPMWRLILGQSVFQLVLVMLLSSMGATWFNVEKQSIQLNTIVFNSFIFCQIFNEYNARNLGDELNPFRGVQNNTTFLYVSFFSIVIQVIMVEFCGTFVGTAPLTINQWLITVALGAIGLPIGFLLRFIPVKEDPNSYFDSTLIKPTTDDKKEDYHSIAINDDTI